jgi:L,D-transpeptidase catalytic domain
VPEPDPTSRYTICIMPTLKAVLLVLQLTSSCMFVATIAEAQSRDGYHIATDGTLLVPSPAVSVPDAPIGNDVRSAGVQAPISPQPVLSSQAEQVSRIAERNGDKDFLMVDKARGEIILFEDGKPTFSGPALTGAGRGDRVPPKVLTFSDSHPLSTEQKVTPAGRFTVRPESDPEYGRVWTITEVHGKDWDFAIHRVYLGMPSENRDARIHSPNVDDRHITFGCINVERSTIQLFTRKLPRKGKTPLYILPQDEATTASFFAVRDSLSAPNGSVR